MEHVLTHARMRVRVWLAVNPRGNAAWMALGLQGNGMPESNCRKKPCRNLPVAW